MQHCLFWVHATVSFFSSLADIAGATVLHSWERRRKSVEVEEEWEVKSEKRTSWECVHHGTTHKAHRCKRRHPSQDQVFDCLIVVRKKKGYGPVGPCVLILSLSQGVHTESLPLVVSRGGITPSIHLQTRVSPEIWRVHTEVIFALLLSLKRDRKNTHCSSLQASCRPDFLCWRSSKCSFVSDDHRWAVVL